MQKVFRNTLHLFTFFLIVNCADKTIDLKKGTFKIVINDSITSYIERNNGFQLEYSIKSREKKELFKIRWETENKYIIEVLNIDKTLDSLDALPLIVKIDSINGNTYYHTTYIEGIDLKYSSKIVKVSNEVSDDFKEAVLRLKN